MNTLNGLTVKILARAAQVFAWPVVLCGIAPGGNPAPLNADASGNIITTAGAGQSVTPNIAAVGASGSGSIPIGAKGWTFTVLSGTATLGGVPVAAGFSDSDPNTLVAEINYTTGASSSAYVRYNT